MMEMLSVCVSNTDMEYNHSMKRKESSTPSRDTELI